MIAGLRNRLPEARGPADSHLMHGHAARMMLHSLRIEKLLNRCFRRRVSRADPQLTAEGQVPIRVLDDSPPGRHHRRAGHVAHVNKSWSAEIASFERVLNQFQVGPDLRDAERVGLVALKLDSSAVRSDVKFVGRSVLIDAHCHLPAFLHLRERGIGLLSGGRLGWTTR